MKIKTKPLNSLSSMKITKSVIKVKKKEKKPFELATKSFSATKNNLNRQLAESIATFYSISFTKYQFKILNLIVSMTANNKYKLIVPSQGWVAKQVGCDIRTVRTAMKLFNDFGIIKKTSRGWRIVKKDFFRAMTCKYSRGKSLVKDMNFIHTYLSKSSAAFTNLWERIPALAKMFPLIFLVTSLVSYERGDIGSLRSPISCKMGFNDGGRFSKREKDSNSSNFSTKGNEYMQEDCDYTRKHAFEIYEDYQSEDYKKWVKHLQWEAKNGKEAQRRKRLKAIKENEAKVEYRRKSPPPKNKELMELTSKLEPSRAFLDNFAKMIKGVSPKDSQ